MLTFLLYSNAYTLTTGSLSVYFQFQKFVFLWPPSHKWHHKPTKIMFQIIQFTLSDRIYPSEYTYIRIEDILWPRQILRVVKVRAIWWGKQPCSFKNSNKKRKWCITCIYSICVVEWIHCLLASMTERNCR